MEMKLKKHLLFAGMLLVILIIFTLSFLNLKKPDHEPIKVDSSEEFANLVVPGWERAESLGLIVDLDIAEPIPGTNATALFEKVWYTPSGTYVLYTVKEPNHKYLMATEKYIDIPPNRNQRDNPSQISLGYRWGGVSREGYHQIMEFQGYNTPVPAKELTLTASDWINPKQLLKPNDKTNVIKSEVSVKLPLSDGFLTEKSEIVKLDISKEWEDRSLRLTGLEIGSSKVLLFGEAKLLEGEMFHHISGSIKSEEGSRGLNYESITPGDSPNSFKFVFRTAPLNEWPAHLSLEVNSIELKSPYSATIPIDWTQYVNEKGRIHVPLDEAPSATLYDSKIRLWIVEPSWISLEIMEPSEKARNKETYITLSDDAPRLTYDNNSPVIVTNENGDTLSLDTSGGGQLGGDERVGIGFGIDPDDDLWKTSKEINITVNKPLVRLMINEEIELKE